MSRNLLLDLPPELRNQVYVEVFRGARARPKGARRWSSSSRQFCDGNGPESAIDDAVHGFGLLTANKQVRDEGLAFFWKETLFDLQPLCDLISGCHWGTFQPGSLTRIENAVCTIVGAFRFSSPSFHEERMGVGATLRQLTTYYVSGSKARDYSLRLQRHRFAYPYSNLAPLAILLTRLRYTELSFVVRERFMAPDGPSEVYPRAEAQHNHRVVHE